MVCICIAHLLINTFAIEMKKYTQNHVLGALFTIEKLKNLNTHAKINLCSLLLNRITLTT